MAAGKGKAIGFLQVYSRARATDSKRRLWDHFRCGMHNEYAMEILSVEKGSKNVDEFNPLSAGRDMEECVWAYSIEVGMSAGAAVTRLQSWRTRWKEK